MSPQRWHVIIAVIIVLAVGGWFILGHSSSPSPSASPTPSASMSMAPQPSSQSTPAATSAVTISNFAFSPANITVKAGTKVTWTNADTAGHTVTETDSTAGPKSSTLSKGQSYSFTFTTPGTYHYDCSIHPYMTGTVTVTQ